MTLLPRTRLCRRIASETAGVIFLRAPAGAGKSVLLEMLAKELGTQICRTHQPRSDDAANDCLLWDVPVFARAVRMPAAILETVRFMVIACRPDQRISGLARQILHRGSLIIGPDELALGQDEIESLPSTAASGTAGLCRMAGLSIARPASGRKAVCRLSSGKLPAASFTRPDG